MTASTVLVQGAIDDTHHYNHLDVAVVLFDIQRHISINGNEPSLDEAKALYHRWFLVDPDDGEVAE